MQIKTKDGVVIDTRTTYYKREEIVSRRDLKNIRRAARSHGNNPKTGKPVQAVIKVSHSKSYGASLNNAKYILREGKKEETLTATDELGATLDFNEVEKRLAEWRTDDQENGYKEGKNRTTTQLIVSSPEGTDREKFEKVVEEWAGKILKNHEFLIAHHNDTKNPHAHIIVKSTSDLGLKIRTGKKEIHNARQAFSVISRRRGLNIHATPAIERNNLNNKLENATFRVKGSKLNISEKAITRAEKDIATNNTKLNKKELKMIKAAIKKHESMLKEADTLWAKSQSKDSESLARNRKDAAMKMRVPVSHRQIAIQYLLQKKPPNVKPPTIAMLKTAIKIGENTGKKYDLNTAMDWDKTSDFIKSQSQLPTQKTSEYIEKIEKRTGIKATQEERSNKKEAAKYIKKNKELPSSKAANYALRVAGAKGIEIPREALSSGKLLSKWIENHSSRKAPKETEGKPNKPKKTLERFKNINPESIDLPENGDKYFARNKNNSHSSTEKSLLSKLENRSAGQLNKEPKRPRKAKIKILER